MVSASVLLTPFVIYACAVLYGSLLSALLTDFIDQFQWTLGGRYWTIRRKSALLLRSRAYPTCKAALAGHVGERRPRRVPLHARFVRYGPWARAVAGRVVVPQRVTSGTSELKPAQRRALFALESEPGTSLTRSEYQRL